MSDDKLTTDEIKGRVKQAAGDLTGDDELHEEGEVDEFAGKAKAKVDDVAEKVSEKIDGLVDRFRK